VTFEDDKKGKVLGTDVMKVNDCFTLNDVALVDRLRYNLLSVSQLCDADLSLIRMFLILPASVFVASLVLEMFSKLIFPLLNLL
jgi:hypothetical protein